MNPDTEPLTEISDGVVYYWESPDAEGRPTKHEGDAEIYPHWVRLEGGLSISSWIPRENVQQVHES